MQPWGPGKICGTFGKRSMGTTGQWRQWLESGAWVREAGRELECFLWRQDWCLDWRMGRRPPWGAWARAWLAGGDWKMGEESGCS